MKKEVRDGHGTEDDGCFAPCPGNQERGEAVTPEDRPGAESDAVVVDALGNRPQQE